MPYIIMLKVRKFHQSTGNRFGTAGKKPVGGGGGGGHNVAIPVWIGLNLIKVMENIRGVVL